VLCEEALGDAEVPREIEDRLLLLVAATAPFFSASAATLLATRLGLPAPISGDRIWS